MTNKIELVDILPTEQEIINYGKYISSTDLESDNEYDYEPPYIITDEDLTDKKLNEYSNYCQEHNIDGDYLLASLITAFHFKMNKGSSDD